MTLWERVKRPLKITLLFSAFSFLLGFTIRYQVPRFKQWLLVEIESKSRTLTPVRVWPQKIYLQLFPLGVSLRDVRILPQGELKSVLAPTTLNRLNVSLSTWSLLKGQIRIGEILVDGTDLNVIVREDKTPAKKKMKFSLEMLYQVPINELTLENINITAKDENTGFLTQIENLQLNVENKYDTLRVTAAGQNVQIKKTGDDAIFRSDIETHFLVDNDGLYFSNLKLQRENSYLVGTGSITGDVLRGKFKDVRAKLRGDLRLNEIERLMREVFGNKSWPHAEGQVNFETDFDYQTAGTFHANYILNANDLKIDRYEIGQTQILGKADDHKFTFSKLSIQNYFGAITAENGVFQLKDKLNFKADVKGDSIELSSLLRSLGIPNVPVFTTFDGQLPCTGQLASPFTLTCTGKLNGRDFDVKTGGKNKEFSIVNFKDFGIDGSVTVNTQAVRYKVGLRIGSSTGTSDGVISYKDGFKINYDTQKLNFKDIQNIAHLKLEGFASLTGKTSGNSHTATIDMKANGQDMWLSDFFLGQPNFNLRYKTGHLYFDKVEGKYGFSHYKGDVEINLTKNQLKIVGQAPYVDAEDLTKIFSRKVILPFAVTGTGSAAFDIHGPLEFSLLSYHLNSSLFRGTVADESFDQLQFNVESQNGFVETRKVALTKGRSQIRLEGNVKPDAMMNINVVGQNFQLEQSENLERLKVNLTGNLDFEMKLTNHILKPNINLNGHLSHVTVGDIPAANSNIKLNITDEAISGEGQFIGSAVETNFRYPFKNVGTAHLEFKAVKWNFAQVFSIFSESLRSGNYTTSLSGQLNLDIPKNDPYKFNAALNITDLLLHNNRAEMRTSAPITLTAKNGLISTQHFEIAGENTFVRLKSGQVDPKALALSLDGHLDLSLASLFTPFLDDIRGSLSFSYALDGTYSNPHLTGSAYVQNGLFKIKGFPHALEEVSGDALFNSDKIIINSVKGRIGGGVMSGNGRIQASHLDEVIVDVKGQFTDSKFNIPEGFTTRGSGDFFVRGNWFPYTVGVNFIVDSGSIERNGTATVKSTPEVKPSTYLPKFLSTQRFSPIQLDLNINMRRQIPVKMEISRIDIRSEVTGQLKVVGPPEAPLLTGRINVVRGGKVTFRNNTFEVQSGYVEYNNSPPEKPILNVQATARVTAQLKDNATRDYDVDLRVVGTPTNPKLTMSSEPALPESELISLLTLGVISEAETESSTENTGHQLANTSYQLGSAIINEQLGINKVFEKRLGMQFNINSSYDTEAQAEKHKFTLRKQWTPKFGTSASREIGKTNANTVRAEYKLNKNLSAIGEWEGTESTGSETAQTAEKAQNIFGLDIEYKVEFK